MKEIEIEKDKEIERKIEKEMKIKVCTLVPRRLFFAAQQRIAIT
jgi:hypothetical protein